MTNDSAETSRRRRRSILFLCLGVSLAIHSIGLYIFYKNPPSLQGSIKSILGKATAALPFVKEEDKISSHQALRETFEQMLTISPHVQKPYHIEKNPLDVSVNPSAEQEVKSEKIPRFLKNPLKIEEKNLPFSLKVPFELPQRPLLGEMSSSYATFSALKEPLFSSDPLSQLTISPLPYLFLHNLKEEKRGAPLPHLESSSSIFPSFAIPSELPSQGESIPSLLKRPIDLKEALCYESPLLPAPSLSQPPETWGGRMLKRKSSLPQIDSYALPEGPALLEWNEDFKILVQQMPDPEREGYLFSLTLVPTLKLNKMRMKQNFYFLIDRSNSIEKHRYEIFKKATLKALNVLQEGDTFNICIFDRKVVRLSETNLPFSKKSLLAAEKFLEKQDSGTLFAATEIYTSLDNILPKAPKNEINTAVLISDGHTLLHLKKQRKSVENWTKQNQGNISLYTAAAGSGNNLVLLNLLSTCNKGRLLYSDTLSAFPRKLAKMLSDLKNPLAKDIFIRVKPVNPKNTISLYPSSLRLPVLYSEQPYVLIGTAEELSDFTLLIEGRHNKNLFSLKKTISFANATEGSRSLEKKWALEEAHIYYESFLADGKPDQLKKAEKLLQTWGEIPKQR